MEASDASQPAVTWFVEPDRVGPRRAWWLGGEDGATSLRAAILTAAFVVLLATTVLLGGHAAIDPLLRIAIAARDGRTVGAVILATRDGKYCRHLSFDNDTAEILEGTVVRCPDVLGDERIGAWAGKFAWAGRAAR